MTIEPIHHQRILILADIEGSSACTDYESTKFLGKGWPKACCGMTRDVNAVVDALFKKGVEKIIVKDFHRTGYNLFQSGIDKRATLISGYHIGPVPGIGPVHDTTGLIMLGMHAPSGSNGFLSHTLTSRILRLEVNGQLMSEAQLFSASLAPFDIVPLFFSGCPVACNYAAREIQGIHCFPIQTKDRHSEFTRTAWRKELGLHAVNALSMNHGTPYHPQGPFHAQITLKGTKKAVQKIASQWGYHYKNQTIHIHADDIHALYGALIHLAYFNPLTLRLMPIILPFFNLMGKTGLAWARNQVKT